MLVAITYVYFLIFAQFGFLARLEALHLAEANLQIVLATMAAGGIAFSLVAPWLGEASSPGMALRGGFACCAAAAALSLLRLNAAGAAIVALLTGAGIGIVTVTLVTHLGAIAGGRSPILRIGLGTGLGYFVCNIPGVFAALPQRQAILAAILCLAGMVVTWGQRFSPTEPIHFGPAAIPFMRALAAFTALVWLDSAAFYIIQHSPSLKAGTWMGDSHLWMNACIHLAAALVSGFILDRRRVSWVFVMAFACLGFACVLLLHPDLAPPASLFYPAGVSLYSVALVAYPSFLTNAATTRQRGRQAAIIYAVAGWIASAFGIGMGQHLGRIPLWFVVVAGWVILLPHALVLLRNRYREAIAVVLVAIAAYLLNAAVRPAEPSSQSSSIERGRQVYIAEGCIHCHSQYVRPNSPDVLMWGPTESLADLHKQNPPLIGNRRQGPDLTQVGARRSPLWLRVHLIDPAQVSGASVMPSYAFLFGDRRGEDLVAYLASLRSGDMADQLATQHAWQAPQPSPATSSSAAGERVYRRYCATCHDPSGETNRKWQASFKELPANLFSGQHRYWQTSGPANLRFAQLARIVKFGIPGTDMPGHEYLPDADVVAVSSWLVQHATTIATQP